MKVWVDLDSGVWGTDDESVYVMDVTPERLEEFVSLDKDERRALALLTGLPLRMLGCTYQDHLEERYDV
jgi:hypothetical protein